MLSQFTQRICDTAAGFDFVAAHFACEADRYSRNNPDGYVNLGSAQNFLHSDRLAALQSAEFHVDDARYQPFSGTTECKQAIADYLCDLSGNAEAEHLLVGNGIISLLEALAIAILDRDDTVLVPTPVFPGLVAALGLRSGARVTHLPLGPETAFRLTPAAVDAAIRVQRADGHRVKAVLVCSPGNPVGQVFDADEISELVHIAETYDCALIVDEVYASSCLDGITFHTALAHTSDRLFVLGGLSKDFGLAGYATGWLHARHDRVRRAVEKQAHFFRLPAPIQRLMVRVLNRETRAAFVTANHRLGELHSWARETLESHHVAVTPSKAGLCLWCDFSDHLETPDAEGQLRLYRHLLESHRVHISPSTGFYCSLPGYFRICVSQEDHVLREGLHRLDQALACRRPARPIFVS